MEKVMIGGIQTVRCTRTELADQMVQDCLKARSGDCSRPKLAFASNGLVLATYHRKADFRRLIDEADFVDADGMPLVIASRMLKTPLPERIATTDFIYDAAAAAVQYGLRFYFLGGRSEATFRASEFFEQIFPGLQIVGRHHGYFHHRDEAALCAEIRDTRADVLWLGLGSPLQEEFAVRNRSRLAGLGWIRTCGGMFDYYSGRSPRAPLWMQGAGLEWLFRAAQEPGRLAPRYVKTNLPALYHLLTKTHSAHVN